MILIGLTGNIATGKSTVMQMLVELGAEAIDADRVAHQTIAKEGEAFADVVAEFGPAILGDDGAIDRAKLGAIVFSDAEALHRLEAIVHPIVKQRVARRLAETTWPVVVVEAIKLIEAGMHQECHSLWVVTCTPAQQLERLRRARGLDETEARRRIAAQPPPSEKIKLADVVIDNSGTIAETRRQVEAAWQRVVGDKT